MFDFLNKPSHQHQKQQVQQKQVSSSKPEPQDIKNERQNDIIRKQIKPQQKISNIEQKPKRNQISLTAKLQLGETAELNQEVMSILQQLREDSENAMGQETKIMIENEKRKVQRKVYLREMSNGCQQYLQQILLQCSSPNRFIRHGLSSICSNVAEQISQDIQYTNKYNIVKKGPMSKNDLMLLENSLSMIKSNEGNIRDKVGQLKLQLRNQAQKINNKSLQIINKDSTIVNASRVKQVEQFIKSIQSDRIHRKKKQLQNVMKLKEKQEMFAQMMQQERAKAKSERHQRMVSEFRLKRKQKQQQKLQQALKNQDFKQWMNKVYKKNVPLYKKKQQEYLQKFVKEEQNQIINKLIKRKQRYSSIDIDEIQQHEQKYLQRKKSLTIQSQMEKKQKKKIQRRIKQQLDGMYKGQFRYFVLKQLVESKEKQEYNPLQEKIMNRRKLKQYSQNVKQSFKPKVDSAKRLQVERNIQSLSGRKKKARNVKRMDADQFIYSNGYSYQRDQQQSEEQEKDPRKEGEKNRRYFKQYIQDKIQRGEVKPKQQDQSLLTPKPIKFNYLEQLKQQRQYRQRTNPYVETIDEKIKKSLKNNSDIGTLLARAEQHDTKVNRLQKKLQNSYHRPYEITQLQDNYLLSIRAKLQLLKSCD